MMIIIIYVAVIFGLIAYLSLPLIMYYNAYAASNNNAPQYKAGYQKELSDWHVIVQNGTNGELHCPLAPHSDFCKGYNDAMVLEAGHQ